METEFVYDVIFSLNLATAFPEVGELMNSVNTHLSSMGYDEKLTLRSRPIKMTLTLKREPTEEEIAKMKNIITAQLCAQFTGSNPVCEAFRRQSGNVPQSVS